MIRKIFIGSVIIGFVLIILFVCIQIATIYNEFNKPKSAEEIASVNYYKLHNKEINLNFIIDSLTYKINDYEYCLKPHSAILIIDIDIKNTTNHSKQYSKYFFEVNNGPKEVYYPSQKPFTVFEHRLQKLKLIYTLPEKMLPYLRYEMHLRSNIDDKQNALIILYKNYREGG